MNRLLLISNSKQFGHEYLDHVAQTIRNFLGDTNKVIFVPYALYDHARYVDIARRRFSEMGYALKSLHEVADPRRAIQNARVLFVGGGNTFRLLERLYRDDTVAIIRERIGEGMVYIGSSAGAVIAGPSIKTTNDMPIVYPPTFESLRVVPFHINVHYMDPDPLSIHQGETRDARIREFLEENHSAVVALREGAYLMVENDRVLLKGDQGGKLFASNVATRELKAGNITNIVLKRLEVKVESNISKERRRR